MTARRPHGLVLDAWAVLAYLQGEAVAERVSTLIAAAAAQNTPLFICTVNAGEVWYTLARALSPADADGGIADLRSWGVQFIDADWALTQQAAVFKAKHRMSYADAFAAALAKGKKAELVTGDPEFKQVEGEISIGWLK